MELDGNKMTYTKDLKVDMLFQDSQNRYGVYYCLLDGEPKSKLLLKTDYFESYICKKPLFYVTRKIM